MRLNLSVISLTERGLSGQVIADTPSVVIFATVDDDASVPDSVDLTPDKFSRSFEHSRSPSSLSNTTLLSPSHSIYHDSVVNNLRKMLVWIKLSTELSSHAARKIIHVQLNWINTVCHLFFFLQLFYDSAKIRLVPRWLTLLWPLL